MTTTTSDQVRVENIPQVLRDCRGWVTWRAERQGGRTVKPPYDPRTGRMASCSNRATWASFEEALVALEEGSYDGIGFQLAPPFVGVDLDGCRDPATGVIDAEARTIIEKLKSYTEVSPSGRGVHILATGELPAGRRRTHGVELYDRDRYFTVTGRRLVTGTSLRVEPRSAELAALHRQLFGSQEPRVLPRRDDAVSPKVDPKASPKAHASASLLDEEVLAKMKAANNGDRFERLWDGEWRGEFPSQSEADLALCSILAFWTGRDAERMDQLFRQSGLYRPKWDEHRGGRTYGETTIATAIRRAYGVWTPPRAKARARIGEESE